MATRKIALVTGANSGIGYETVKALLQSPKPYHVFLGSRSLENARLAVDTLHKECPEVTNTVESLQVDLTSDDSIQKAFEQVKANPGHVDTLINNAGKQFFPFTPFPLFHFPLHEYYLHTKYPLTGATFDIEFVQGKTSLRECFTRAYDVNVAGTQVLTWTFMPLLLQSSDPG